MPKEFKLRGDGGEIYTGNTLLDNRRDWWGKPGAREASLKKLPIKIIGSR